LSRAIFHRSLFFSALKLAAYLFRATIFALDVVIGYVFKALASCRFRLDQTTLSQPILVVKNYFRCPSFFSAHCLPPTYFERLLSLALAKIDYVFKGQVPSRFRLDFAHLIRLHFICQVLFSPPSILFPRSVGTLNAWLRISLDN